MKILLNVLKYLLFFSIGAALLYLALHNLSWQKIINGFMQANYFFVALALAVGLISHYFRALRWNILIESLEYKISVKNSFIAVLINYMVNFAVPRMGEISRCIIINRTDRIPMNKLIGTVLIERLFDVFVLLLIIFLTFIIQFKRLKDLIYDYIFIPFQHKVGSASIWFWLIGALIIIAVMVVALLSIRFIRHKSKTNTFFKKVHDMLSGFYSGIKSIFSMEKKWRFIVFTIGIWICYWMMTYVMFFATDTTSVLGLGAGLSALAIGSIGMVIPSPGGIGSWHYAVILALTFYKPVNVALLDWQNGTALYTLICHESQMIFLILVGVVAYLYFILSQKKIKADERISENN